MIYNDDLLIGINVTIIMIKQSANIGSQIADDKDVYSLRFILEDLGYFYEFSNSGRTGGSRIQIGILHYPAAASGPSTADHESNRGIHEASALLALQLNPFRCP